MDYLFERIQTPTIDRDLHGAVIYVRFPHYAIRGQGGEGGEIRGEEVLRKPPHNE